MDVKTIFLHGELQEEINNAATKKVCSAWERRSCMFAQKISLWFETIT